MSIQVGEAGGLDQGADLGCQLAGCQPPLFTLGLLTPESLYRCQGGRGSLGLIILRGVEE